MDLQNVAPPRLGLAFRINNKTVLRGGYGIFRLRNDVAFNISPNNDPVNAYTTPFVGTTDGSLTPLNRLGNPFPTGIIPAPGHSPNFQQLFLGQGFSAPLPHDPAGYAQQWNFGIQRQLPSNVAVEIDYAGSEGSHLPVPKQQLEQRPQQCLTMCA